MEEEGFGGEKGVGDGEGGEEEFVGVVKKVDGGIIVGWLWIEGLDMTSNLIKFGRALKQNILDAKCIFPVICKT